MSETAEYRPPTPWVVWLIVGAIALAFAGFELASREQQNAIDFMFALIPERFHAESPYHFSAWYEAFGPVFGHAFLHVAWWHAGLNGFFLFALSRYPAMRLGPWRYLALFFLSAAGSAAVFLALNWNEQAIAVGASGALCGVFSAYFLSARATWQESLADRYVRNQFLVIFAINVVAMGVAAEVFSVPIAWEAHLGGFIAGALAWIALAPRAPEGLIV